LLDLPGKINVGNALLLFALCCDVFDIPPLTVAKKFEGMTIDGRAEVVISPLLPDVTFIIDYAHNGASLSAILGVLRGYDPERLVCLFGSVGERTFMRRGELARAAAEGADACILTSDNPGRESPEKIISEIDAAFPDCYPPRVCISDRREAIEYAVQTAKSGDIILLAGKGHEDYQLVGIQRLPFCERDIINEAVDKLFAVTNG
jgi:UDP-N-acetylmuramoyl-L-alanyl-D-glutamate--2,6-diaminopimelate ligase